MVGNFIYKIVTTVPEGTVCKLELGDATSTFTFGGMCSRPKAFSNVSFREKVYSVRAVLVFKSSRAARWKLNTSGADTT